MSAISKTQNQDLHTRMRGIIEQFPGSGKTVPEFCSAHDLSVSRYHYWRKKLGYCFRKTKGAVDFVQVDFKERSYSARYGFNRLLHYELQLPGGRLLRIPFEFDMSSLRRLLDILQA